MPRRPLPSPGSLRVWFPGLIGTMRRSDFLLPIPGGSLTRPPVPPSRCLFRSRRRPTLPTTGQGFGLPAPLPGLSGRREQDLPSSRQILSIHALLPSDPGGIGAPGHSALARLPSARDTASAPTLPDRTGHCAGRPPNLHLPAGESNNENEEQNGSVCHGHWLFCVLTRGVGPGSGLPEARGTVAARTRLRGGDLRRLRICRQWCHVAGHRCFEPRRAPG